jgi:hypothetical protein
MSSNLRNQSYYFYNQKLSREKYLGAMAELEINKYSNLEKLKEVFKDLIKNKTIHKYGQIISSENVSGNYIFNSKNIDKSFDIWDSENVKYSMRTTQNVKDSYDLQGTGRNAELIYEALASSINTYKNSFVYITLTCKETEYSLNLKNCSNCFGCVGLTNAQYCIFNKQYTKEEYFEMLEKIKKHMNDMPYIDKKGRVFKYGEFFPYDMSPFGYNETNAHDFFPISKEESIDKGYNWYDRESRDYNPTILSKDLPDDINEVDESILNEIISCPNNGDALTQCTTAFRIVQIVVIMKD